MQMFRVQIPLTPACTASVQGGAYESCGTTRETRKGIPVWLDLSLVLPKLTPSLHAFRMKLYFNVNRLVGYIVLEVVLKLS